MKRRTLLGTALAGATVASLARPALAQGAYYAGKTIRVIIPFSAGGGTDTFGRYIAQFLGRHVPGNPTVIAENVTGAGGLRGSNEFAERTAKDGLTLLTASGHLNLRAFLGLQGLRLKLDGLEPVVAAPMGHVTALNVKASGINDPKQFLTLRGRVTKGITDPVGLVESLVALEMFEINYRAVPGFGGRGDTRLAFERGELMITTQATPAYLARVKPMVDAGEAIPLYAIGFVDPEGKPVRDPAASDIITAPELYQQIHGRMPSGDVWNAYRVIANLVQNTRGTLWVHSDAPAEARAALTAGVNAMVQDAAFKEAGARIMEGYDIISGAGLGQIKADLNAAPPEVLAWTRTMLTSKFGVRFDT
jgi:tripartite-type tricarboxylate transporter receptor subunit TctC